MPYFNRNKWQLIGLSCLVAVLWQAASATGAIDLTTCGKMKGCLLSPLNCTEATCQQIVTWQVSPLEPANVRFELQTATIFDTNKTVDYIAFGLSTDPKLFMINTSVLVCAYNNAKSTVWAYLSHNANDTTTILPGDGSKIGVSLVASSKTESTLSCVIDRAIEPSPSQVGLAFPLNQPWSYAFAVGPTDPVTGLVEHHVHVGMGDDLVKVTDYAVVDGIDLSGCNKTRGCFVNPPGCESSNNCTQMVTWYLLPDDPNYVRFEMAALSNYTYIAFGLSVGDKQSDIMGNTSVLACAFNETTNNFIVYNSHNKINEQTGHYENVLASQPNSGIRLVSYAMTNDLFICTVDRVVKPDPALNGVIFPLDRPWYPAWATGQTKNGYLQYHYDTKNKGLDQVVVTGPYSPYGPPIDLTKCGSEKGCRLNPDECSPSGNCSQIVTWQVSPDDSSMVRFEMSTVTNYTGEEIDYIAFGLSVNTSSIMMNTSVLVCAFNRSSSEVTAFLSHNANHTNTILPPSEARVGITLVSWEMSEKFISCVIDRAIEPTPEQAGLAFPLNKPWIPAVAAGPTNETTGLVEHHKYANYYDQAVTLTDYANGSTIDVSQCNITRGCLLSPPGCKSFDDCTQIVTWQLLPGGDYVRFELAATRDYQYIAFGLSVGDDEGAIMGNTSVLACAYNETTSQVIVFNSHNQVNSVTKRYENVITSQPELGLKPMLTKATNDRIICVVDRVVKPDPSLDGIIFPLDQSWYPVWATGPTSNGQLQYHHDSRQNYLEPVICTQDVSPPDPTTTTTTMVPPVGPVIDLKTCNVGKGCYQNPPDCNPSTSCSQIVTWTVSPDDPAAVRFEMAATRTYKSNAVQYIAFGLSVDLNSIMMNTSVLVCAINQSDSTATAYLSHNADVSSTPLPVDQYKVGVDLIRSEVAPGYVFCVVDRKIMPTPDQTGLVFPLYQSFYPAVAAGPTDGNGILKKHIFAEFVKTPTTVTDFTNQTSIDISLCGIARGCLLNPPDCKSLLECTEVVTWSVLQSGDYVRFQMATARTHDFVAFGLAPSPDLAGFMGNGSVLACLMNETDTMPMAYHSHNQQVIGGYKSVITNDATIGIRAHLTVASSDRLMCVLDQVVHPDPSLNGLIFPLDQPWYPAWSSGPTVNGALGYHGTQKMGYGEAIVCTKPFSPSPPHVVDKTLYKKLHALFMMFGWMVCAACSILTPRYLRKHWTSTWLFDLQFWFVVHRTLMLIGIACVIVGFALILDVENYMIINEDDFPDRLHPYFGLVAIVTIFMNPIIAMFRCKPDHEHRPLFNCLHGLIGFTGFLFGAANLIIGALMFTSPQVIYPVAVWAGLHALVEITYLVIWLATRKEEEAEHLPLVQSLDDGPGPSSMSATSSISSLAQIDDEQPKSKAYILSTGIFVVYFVSSIVLAAVASAFVFENNAAS